jgi:hypothetical protein
MHAPCYIIICGLSGWTIFLSHIISWTARFSGKIVGQKMCVLILSEDVMFVWGVKILGCQKGFYIMGVTYHAHLWQTKFRPWKHSCLNTTDFTWFLRISDTEGVLEDVQRNDCRASSDLFSAVSIGMVETLKSHMSNTLRGSTHTHARAYWR